MLAPDRQQLDTLVARACPGERLATARPLADDRWELALAGGETLQLLCYLDGRAAAAAVAALRLLRGEFDLPIPQLRAADPVGETIGQPYLLVSGIGGEPLPLVLPRLSGEQLYGLGRRLGELAYRVHRLALSRYGALVGPDTAAADDERGYAQARLTRALVGCGELGLLNRQVCDELRAWFDQSFAPVGRQPALLHGGLGLDHILVRQVEDGWHLSGLLGWQQAVGWSPAWEHVTFLDQAEGAALFALRVGYGNGYDELAQRTYEQVREHALAPYRLLLALEQLWREGAQGDLPAADRRRAALLNRVRG